MAIKTYRMAGRAVSLFSIILFVSTTATAKTIYVDADGSADYDNIQPAIDAAVNGDIIIVRDGTYRGNGNRDIDFKGKAITVRSENGPENCIIDCEGTETEPHRGFYFHTGEDENSAVDGFTVSNGFHWVGGGICCYGSSPTITNNIIKGNRTYYDGDGGAGIACFHGGSPTITNNIITQNDSTDISGGGIRCYEAGSPTIANNKITGNCGHSGGGVHCSQSVSPLIMNNIIVGNTGRYWGGGISCWGFATIMNNIIAGNTAKYGGGIRCANFSATITNNTIVGNMAGAEGGGIWCGKGSSPTMTNCILWGNAAPKGPQVALRSDLYYGPSALTVNYSDLAGGQAHVYIEEGCTLNWGLYNIDADPYFVEPGYWDANGLWVDGDYHLLLSSPCIDAGDPNYIPEPNETDLDGKPRVIGGRIDMGAYEYRFTISAEARIVPRTINLASKGNWITCYIWLPEDYNVADIDPNSILLEDEIEAESVQVDVQKQVVMARFSREGVQAVLNPPMAEQVELTISGQLMDGTVFEATDEIRIMDKGSQK